MIIKWVISGIIWYETTLLIWYPTSDADDGNSKKERNLMAVLYIIVLLYALSLSTQISSTKQGYTIFITTAQYV